MKLFGEWVKFKGLVFDCGFLRSLFANEFLDRPDDWIKQSPFDFFKYIAYCSFIVELPGENNTESKCTSQNRKTVEEIKVNFWGNMKSHNESTKLLKTEGRADLPSIGVTILGKYELTC